MQKHKKSALSKSDYFFWWSGNFVGGALSGTLAFILPLVHSLDNDTFPTQLSSTPQGRWQIASSSFVETLIVALIPAALSYGFSKLLCIPSGRDFKSNRALHMAIAVWLAQIVLGLIGGIAFWLGRSPFYLFGR